MIAIKWVFDNFSVCQQYEAGFGNNDLSTLAMTVLERTVSFPDNDKFQRIEFTIITTEKDIKYKLAIISGN